MGAVRITQYLRPNGEKRPMTVEVPDTIATLAEGMVLSCEVLMTGQVAIYCRWAGEDEDAELCLLASNGPHATNQPDMVVAEIVTLCAARPKP